MEQIIKDYLDSIENKEIKDIFGNWIDNINEIKEQYLNAKPFEHVIIPNFLNEEYAEFVYNEFPTNFDNWYKYHNPIEVKYTYDKINDMKEHIKNLFYSLCTKKLLNIFSDITNINLEYDPYLHGAGLHAHPTNGRLNIHLDYEKHPLLENKQRRLNIILYLSKDWNIEWNGQTELWNKDMTQCIVKSPVIFNQAILFKTNEISWHGLPEKLKCPENIYRKSLAFYYISELEAASDSTKFGNNGSGYRVKATFIKRPSDQYNEKMDTLYKLRPLRRIEQKDMDEIWPEWNEKDY
jgi:Rps23 Pro-64 3,4-dihydroxylase Tpa1-like proline 4-hydroxylase